MRWPLTKGERRELARIAKGPIARSGIQLRIREALITDGLARRISLREWRAGRWHPIAAIQITAVGLRAIAGGAHV